MFTLRRAGDRGHFDHGWLNTWHTFSFGRYFDRDQMGFRALRVMNEDFVQPGKGFGEHPHDNMEIVTYVLSGELEHRDSLGNVAQIPAGEVQRMTAGTGIAHSEYNASPDRDLRLLQIWIRPAQQGLPPSYAQMAIEPRDGLTWIASGDGTPGTIHIHQDVRVARVRGVGEHVLPLMPQRIGFLQVVHGSAVIGGATLAVGDALAIAEESDPVVQLAEHAEVLWFDLPALRR